MLTALIVGIIVFALAFWVLGLIGFPAPWNRIAQVVLGLVALLYFLGLIGIGPGVNF